MDEISVVSRTVSVSCCQDVLIICESESDLEFFADCEDSDIDDDDGISDNELTDAVSIYNVYIRLHFVLQHQRIIRTVSPKAKTITTSVETNTLHTKTKTRCQYQDHYHISVSITGYNNNENDNFITVLCTFYYYIRHHYNNFHQ